MSTRSLILLVDDDVMVRNVVRMTLQGDKYAILIAADGSEALELARMHAGAIDLLLTDVRMPFIDGISLYRQVSAECPNIKVLFMSGHLPGQLELPPSLSFLAKPFVPATLRTKVHEILKGPPPSVKGFKVILVVDHNANRRERTKSILTDAGYGVLTASSVEEAEKASDSVATIDLIISGVVFPGQSGVNLAEHVEASARNISTLLISHFHPDLLRNMAGFSKQPEFLPNPFTPEALLAHVRRLLE